jgi:hypothetical protein
MKIIINIFLILLIGLLAFMLYSSIKEPIAFGEEKERRKAKVVQSLENIRTTQELYFKMTGEYAPSFEVLVNAMTNDSIPFVKLTEDPEDPGNTEKFIETITYSAAIDSINKLGIDLSILSKVPYADNLDFEITSDTMEYQSTNVWVTEVGTKWKYFMGEFADPRFAKYDSKYDPNVTIKFGDLNKPSLAGSWSR